MSKLRKVLLFLVFCFMVSPVALASHTTACFQCSGVDVVLLPTGFWVASDWFCPHGHFFFPRGFHQFPQWIPVYRFLYTHAVWTPAYLPPRGENWENFLERYLKEQSKAEKEEVPLAFSDGDLIKSFTSQQTYLYVGASLHYVPDAKTLSAIGAKRNLRIVSQRVLAAIPVGESLPNLSDGILLKGSEPQVYLLKNNLKKAIPEKKLVGKKGVQIKTVPDWLLELIPNKGGEG